MIRKIEIINKLKILIFAILAFWAGNLLQVDLIIPLLLFSLLAYLNFSEPNLKEKNYNLLNLSLLFIIIFVTAYFIVKNGWPVFWIPFSIIPMLATMLFGRLEISLLLTLASAIVCASIAGNNYYLGVMFLISGIVSSLFVQDVRKRSVVIQAGFVIGFTQVIILFFIDQFRISAPNRYLILMSNGVICSVIVLGILPVFEYLFKTVTNISLLELADFNHPLLQRMILEAPGTYHHSLIVGNLSESACQAVGANALLARVGAYYHDIGKLSKPDYFSENQILNENKHDVLAPSMSKLVIMNHVKEGVELAHKYKLNPRLVDFIQQHHGSSLVYYFYRRALESLEEDQDVKEEGFRYPGPKPDTKEAAIVLLADSVEAATRALKDPSPAKIEEIAHKVVNNKFIDGQLDECDLTLKDFEKISVVFIRILSGIYHSRVAYPEGSKSENNHKRSTKENPHPNSDAEKNKKSHS